jgi:hypothetical protein
MVQEPPAIGPLEARRGWVADAGHRLAGFVLCTASRPHDPAACRLLPTLAEFFRGLAGRRMPQVLQVKVIGLCVAAEWPRPAVERALLGR